MQLGLGDGCVAYLLHVVSAPAVLGLMGILALPVVFLLIPPATKAVCQPVG